MSRLAVIAPVAILSCVGAAAQPPTAYEAGTVIVRIDVPDEATLDTLLNIADGVACESVGVGPVELLLSPTDLEMVHAMGLSHDVVVDDVAAQVRAERGRIDAWHHTRSTERRGGFMPGDETFYEMFHPLADLETHMAQLASARPDLCRTEVIGQSIEGRDITALVISAPGETSSRAAVVFIGTQHAREWAGTMTTLYLAERLVADFDTDPRVRALMHGVEFWVVPVSNPDGYHITWNGARYWRKNARPNPGGTFGVDLNRNWSVDWGTQPGPPISDNYPGTGPFSEPETQALRDMTLALGDRVAACIDYHSFSQVILTPWAYTTDLPPEPDATLFQQTGDEMAGAIFDTTGAVYDAGPAAATLYRVSGGAQDWYYADRGAAGFTIELRSDTFLLPPEEILPCGRENFAAALVFTEMTAGPLPTADLNSDGLFNNADINLFVGLFLAGDPGADITADSFVNNADINRFITLFLAGV